MKIHHLNNTNRTSFNSHYNGAMISERLYLLQFKRLPSKQVSPYKDPFRKLHSRNQDAIKKASKTERRYLKQDNLKQEAHHMREAREARQYANHRFKLLNVI